MKYPDDFVLLISGPLSLVARGDGSYAIYQDNSPQYTFKDLMVAYAKFKLLKCQ